MMMRKGTGVKQHEYCHSNSRRRSALYGMTSVKLLPPRISKKKTVTECRKTTNIGDTYNRRKIICRARPAQQEDAMALLLEERMVFLGNELDMLVAESVVASLLYLDGDNPEKDIRIFINSPGGPVNPAMAVMDAINYCRCDVSTIAVGLVASSASFALAAGTKGKRLSFPNSRIMIHQPLGDSGGFASEYEVSTKEMMYHKTHMAKLLGEMCGKPWEQVDKDTDRDRYMSAIEAKDYGLIDEIIGGAEAVYEMPADKAEWVLDQDLWTPDRQYD